MTVTFQGFTAAEKQEYMQAATANNRGAFPINKGVIPLENQPGSRSESNTPPSGRDLPEGVFGTPQRIFEPTIKPFTGEGQIV